MAKSVVEMGPRTNYWSVNHCNDEVRDKHNEVNYRPHLYHSVFLSLWNYNASKLHRWMLWQRPDDCISLWLLQQLYLYFMTKNVDFSLQVVQKGGAVCTFHLFPAMNWGEEEFPTLHSHSHQFACSLALCNRASEHCELRSAENVHPFL